MKKHLNYLCAAILAAMFLLSMALSTACNGGDDAPVGVASVTLDTVTLSLSPGEGKTLTATVLPGNAANKDVTWSSNNTNTAVVENGAVTAIAPGQAVITATTVDGGITAFCVLTVAYPNPVTGVTLNANALTLRVGESQTLTASVLPSNATNKDVAWSTSDFAVVSVANGGIRGESAGQATITATTADGKKTASCVVTVNPPAEYPNPVTGVTLDTNALPLPLGESRTLTATVLPSNATNKNVAWSTSNFAVVSVTNGIVKAVSAGQATIKAITADGQRTASCIVTVAPERVRGISLRPRTALGVNLAENYQPTFDPPNASNKNVTWTSSNTDVATVNEVGFVSALAAGTATITARSEDGGFEASSELTVVNTYIVGTYGPLNADTGRTTYLPALVTNNRLQVLLTQEEEQQRDARGATSSVFVTDGGDVYVGGYYTEASDRNRRPRIWKNGGLYQSPSIGAGRMLDSDHTSIFLSGNDLYMAGSDAFNERYPTYVPKLWKNGEPQPLDLSDDGYAYSVAVSGDDVYVAGYAQVSTDEGPVSKAVLWKNGAATVLNPQTGTSAVAYSVLVSDGDVYVSGYHWQRGDDFNTPVVWKNGAIQRLPAMPRGGTAYSVSVSGQDVHVAGRCFDARNEPRAAYWINGVLQDLGYGDINRVVVLDGHVFLSGMAFVADEFGSGGRVPFGMIWINGAPFRLGSDNYRGGDFPHSITFADSIFVTK